MTVEKDYFQGKNRTDLFYGVYLPDEAEACVVFIHGIFETFEAYENHARRLAKNRIAFVSFDYRGSGKSGGTGGYVGSYLDWVEDIRLFLNMLEKQEWCTGIPLFVLAYSMGSLIGLAYLLKEQPRIQGVILGATGYAFSPLVHGLCLISRFFHRFFPDHYLRPPDMRRLVNSHDHSYSLHNALILERLYPAIGAELLTCLRYVKKNLKELQIPVLVQCAGSDFFFRGKARLYHYLETKDKTFRLYEKAKHDIYKEIKTIRRQVAGDLIEWIAARTAKYHRGATPSAG